MLIFNISFAHLAFHLAFRLFKHLHLYEHRHIEGLKNAPRSQLAEFLTSESAIRRYSLETEECPSRWCIAFD